MKGFFIFVLFMALWSAESAKKEDVIEEVNANQLSKLVQESDYVAVYWYKRNCKDCDKILAELETIDDDTDRFGVQFVKIADKKLAKSYGVKTFPALSYFRNREPIHYEGDLMDEESILQFLTSLEAMELPDQIEEVNAKILDKVVEDQQYVAVLFCPKGPICEEPEHKTECRKCVKVLAELENIDDDADQLGIAFVKINDPVLADEYSLGTLPALVYYRRRIPVVYDGDLMNEDKVLEWLVENKNTGDDDDVIDDITAGLLNTLIDSMDHLAVIFYDREEADDMEIIQGLEEIDDDLDKHGVHIVKICDEAAAREYGLEESPALVYFEHEIPSLYDGDLRNEEAVLAWLVEQLNTDEIEDITDEMLDKLIREADHLAVLFYDGGDAESDQAVTELENIDDECDTHGISFVKIDNEEEATEYGIEDFPTLVYFERGIPSVYSGNLLAEDEVLEWLIHQVESDEIEEVTDEMLDRLIDKAEHLAVLFYDKSQKKSRKVLAELENIDDECDARGVMFVKIDNDDEAAEYGIDVIPTLVYFESEIPYIFEGDLMKEEEVLEWLFHHVENEEIADITEQMLDKLIASEPFLAVLFYEKSDQEDHEILEELENIDDDCEQAGVPLVKIDNPAEAREYGIDNLPTLVYFENRIPSIYEGDLSDEMGVLAWLLHQKAADTIEEVTDEILDDLISNFEYVVVYFSGPCKEGESCDNILKILENLDDDTDDQGMHFVTTEEIILAKQHGIRHFPTLVLFRNGEAVVYKGELDDADVVLQWLTSDKTLEIPNQIEEVNERMLERLLNISNNVAVLFYNENDKKAKKILGELENIDDECDDIGIDFVKISDEGAARQYELVHLPALVFFRSHFPQIYEGDLSDEEALLEWLIDNKDKGPMSIIEEVEGNMLQSLIDSFEYIVVYFYDENCPTCETVLAELETIDDEADDVGIQFVKTNDVEVAEDLGISHLPALVYFEGGVPSIYDAEVITPIIPILRSIFEVKKRNERIKDKIKELKKTDKEIKKVDRDKKKIDKVIKKVDKVMKAETVVKKVDKERKKADVEMKKFDKEMEKVDKEVKVGETITKKVNDEVKKADRKEEWRKMGKKSTHLPTEKRNETKGETMGSIKKVVDDETQMKIGNEKKREKRSEEYFVTVQPLKFVFKLNKKVIKLKTKKGESDKTIDKKTYEEVEDFIKRHNIFDKMSEVVKHERISDKGNTDERGYKEHTATKSKDKEEESKQEKIISDKAGEVVKHERKSETGNIDQRGDMEHTATKSKDKEEESKLEKIISVKRGEVVKLERKIDTGSTEERGDEEYTVTKSKDKEVEHKQEKPKIDLIAEKRNNESKIIDEVTKETGVKENRIEDEGKKKGSENKEKIMTADKRGKAKKEEIERKVKRGGIKNIKTNDYYGEYENIIKEKKELEKKKTCKPDIKESKEAEKEKKVKKTAIERKPENIVSKEDKIENKDDKSDKNKVIDKQFIDSNEPIKDKQKKDIEGRKTEIRIEGGDDKAKREKIDDKLERAKNKANEYGKEIKKPKDKKRTKDLTIKENKQKIKIIKKLETGNRKKGGKEDKKLVINVKRVINISLEEGITNITKETKKTDIKEDKKELKVKVIQEKTKIDNKEKKKMEVENAQNERVKSNLAKEKEIRRDDKQKGKIRKMEDLKNNEIRDTKINERKDDDKDRNKVSQDNEPKIKREKDKKRNETKENEKKKTINAELKNKGELIKDQGVVKMKNQIIRDKKENKEDKEKSKDDKQEVNREKKDQVEGKTENRRKAAIKSDMETNKEEKDVGRKKNKKETRKENFLEDKEGKGIIEIKREEKLKKNKQRKVHEMADNKTKIEEKIIEKETGRDRIEDDSEEKNKKEKQKKNIKTKREKGMIHDAKEEVKESRGITKEGEKKADERDASENVDNKEDKKKGKISNNKNEREVVKINKENEKSEKLEMKKNEEKEILADKKIKKKEVKDGAKGGTKKSADRPERNEKEKIINKEDIKEEVKGDKSEIKENKEEEKLGKGNEEILAKKKYKESKAIKKKAKKVDDKKGVKKNVGDKAGIKDEKIITKEIKKEENDSNEGNTMKDMKKGKEKIEKEIKANFKGKKEIITEEAKRIKQKPNDKGETKKTIDNKVKIKKEKTSIWEEENNVIKDDKEIVREKEFVKDTKLDAEKVEVEKAILADSKRKEKETDEMKKFDKKGAIQSIDKERKKIKKSGKIKKEETKIAKGVKKAIDEKEEVTNNINIKNGAKLGDKDAKKQLSKTVNKEISIGKKKTKNVRVSGDEKAERKMKPKKVDSPEGGAEEVKASSQNGRKLLSVIPEDIDTARPSEMLRRVQAKRVCAHLSQDQVEIQEEEPQQAKPVLRVGADRKKPRRRKDQKPALMIKRIPWGEEEDILFKGTLIKDDILGQKVNSEGGKTKKKEEKRNITEEDEVLQWLIHQRHEDTIENINRQMLYTLIDTQDYLAVYFFNDENPECPKVLKTLEKIDDEAAEYGVQMVKMNDRLMAKKYGFRNPPGLVYFRKGKHIKYDGDLFDEEDVLDWLTSPENMELNDAIEKVNRKMFERIKQTTDYLAVFFYSDDGCKQCQKVLAELENIDDEADANGIDFVKIADHRLSKEVGVYALPAIVFYRKGSEEPVIYAGDLKNEENILSWLLTEKDPAADFIEDLTGDQVIRTIRDSDAVAVYFYECNCNNGADEDEDDGSEDDNEVDEDGDKTNCESCSKVLDELENIDDDTDRIGVKFVKTQDSSVAERYGVNSVPALLYFEHQIPTVFEGDLVAEEEVLQWLILQKTEDRIETINRNMLEVMLDDTQYLAVFFYKPNCRACDAVLTELENIDDDCDLYGIHMVKIQDPQLAKRYGIKTLPALIYFRNGNPLIFDGDLIIESSVYEWLIDEENRELMGEIEVVNRAMLNRIIDSNPFVAALFMSEIKSGERLLEWLSDDENRELVDEIEHVNTAMFDQLVEQSTYLAALFYDDECQDCDQVLHELENIDDEVDMFGIDFVKINDPEAAQRFNIIHTPALVYFRKKTPLIYDGDLLDEEKVFNWLTSQDVFEIKDEIEEVNRKMLEKLLDENDFVAVYFYENNCPKCDEVLEELEKIDSDTDDLDITFVKIKDPRYAKKYGMAKLPALVYFRRKFPSIYRGDLMVEEEVLDWLQKNRFKHPELNLFMYAIGAITVAFIMYTVFLIFCFRSPHAKTA